MIGVYKLDQRERRKDKDVRMKSISGRHPPQSPLMGQKLSAPETVFPKRVQKEKEIPIKSKRPFLFIRDPDRLSFNPSCRSGDPL